MRRVKSGMMDVILNASVKTRYMASTDAAKSKLEYHKLMKEEL